MAPDFSYNPRTTNDKSVLTPGWHPAYLVQIANEETPQTWAMYAQSPRLWRWVFAVWESPTHVGQSAPELQSVPTSQKFSPGGKMQASKAYVFTRKLIGRAIEPGEHINLDPLMPLPCQVLVTRTDKNGSPIEYANLTDLQPWPGAARALTPDFRQNLQLWLQMKLAGTAPQTAPAAPSTPLPAAPIPPTGGAAETAPGSTWAPAGASTGTTPPPGKAW